MRILTYNSYQLEIIDELTYIVRSSDNNFNYDFVYHDTDSLEYKSCCHGVKIYQDELLVGSAIVCDVGGATDIYKNSIIIDQNTLLICCANKLFSLNLTDLNLNRMTQIDIATCFGVFEANDGLFTNGELEVTRLDKYGNIVWQTGLRDILVNIDNEQDCFILHDAYMELQDFNSNIYHLDLNGTAIKETLSESQKRDDSIGNNGNPKKWWEFWD